MSDFDPNRDPETQDEADAYVDWCATNFMRLSNGPARTHRTGVRCAAWLFVVATAGLHLDESIEENREALLAQLAMYQALGRAIERQRQHFTIERLIVLRSSLDCWESVGEWADHLLCAAKCAASALTLVELHPLVDLWDVRAMDVWALLDAGTQFLADINLAEDVTFEDYSIRPDEMVTAKFTWQRANNLSRSIGMGPLSPN